MPLTRITSNVITDGTIVNADISSSTIIDRAKLQLTSPAGVKTVYLAPRTDGVAGSGTELDPYDVGSFTNNIFSVQTLTAGGTTTATCTTTTAHGFETKTIVRVSGASPSTYNGDFLVTVTGPTTFTYKLASAVTPAATGTITCSFSPEQVAANKYDAVISDRTKCPERCTIKLLPGNYFTNGTQFYSQYSPQAPSATYRVWYPANCSVIGSGMDCTKITQISSRKLYNGTYNSKGRVIDIFSNPANPSGLSIISDITIDANWQNLKPTTNPALMPGYPYQMDQMLVISAASISGGVEYGIIERVKSINCGGDWTNAWESFPIGNNAKKMAIVRDTIVSDMVEGWDNAQPYCSAIGAICELIQIPLFNNGVLQGYTYEQSSGVSMIENCLVIGGSPNHPIATFAFSPSTYVHGNYCTNCTYGIHVDTGYPWRSNVVNNYFGNVAIAASFNFTQDTWSTPSLPNGASYSEYLNFENNIVEIHPREAGYNRILRIAGNTKVAKVNNNYFVGKNTKKGISSVSFDPSNRRMTITTTTPHGYTSGSAFMEFSNVLCAPAGQSNNGTLKNVVNSASGPTITVTSPTTFYWVVDPYFDSQFPDLATGTYQVSGLSTVERNDYGAEIVFANYGEVKNNVTDGIAFGGFIMQNCGVTQVENNKYSNGNAWFEAGYTTEIKLDSYYNDRPESVSLVCSSTAPYTVTATVSGRVLRMWDWDNGLQVKISNASVPAYNGTYTIQNLTNPPNGANTSTFQFVVPSQLANANATATCLLSSIKRGRDFIRAWRYIAQSGVSANRDTTQVGTMLVGEGTYNITNDTYYRMPTNIFPYTYDPMTITGVNENPENTVLLIESPFRINTSAIYGNVGEPTKFKNLTLKNLISNNTVLVANEKTEADNCIFGFIQGLTGIYRNCKFLEPFVYIGGNNVNGVGWLCGIAENCEFNTVPQVITRQLFAVSPFPELIMRNCVGNLDALVINKANNVLSRIENCRFTRTGSNKTLFILDNVIAFNNYFQNHTIRIDESVDDKIFNCIFDFTNPSVTLINNRPVTISSITESAGIAVATANNNGFAIGDVVKISGATPSAYNANHTITNVTTNTFTFNIASGTGNATVPGTASPLRTISVGNSSTNANTIKVNDVTITPYSNIQ